MKEIKVLGSGCANCSATVKLIKETAKGKGVLIKLEKITDMAEIQVLGVI